MTRKQETGIIILLAAINFVNIVDFMVLMPLAAQIKDAFQLGAPQWGGVVSVYTIAAFFSGILALFMIDRFNRKSYLMINMVGFAIGTLLCGLANSYASMLFARIATGLFGGVIGSVSIAIITDIVPMERRGRAMGIYMAGFSAAAALGVPFGTVLGAKNTFGWNFPFMALTVIGILLLALCYKVLPRITPQKNDHTDRSVVGNTLNTIRQIVTDTNQLWGFLMMCLLVFAQFMIVPFFSPYLVSNLGLDEMQLAGVYFVGGISSIIINPYVGKLSDRHGPIKVFTVLALLACLPMWFCTSMHDVPYILILVGSAAFFAFAGGRFTPAVALMISTAKPQQRGIFNTLRNSIQNGFAGIAAFTAGLVITQTSPNSVYSHYEIAGYIAIGVNLISIWAIRKMKAVS